MAKKKNNMLLKLVGGALVAVAIVATTVLVASTPPQELRQAASAQVIDGSGAGCLAIGGDWSANTCTMTKDYTGQVDIKANDVTLDCAGFHVNGIGQSYAIGSIGYNGITIQNCSATSSSPALHMYNTSNSTIQNNTFTSLASTGLNLGGNSPQVGNIIIGNTVTDSYIGFFIASQTAGTTITGNTSLNNNNNYYVSSDSTVDAFNSNTGEGSKIGYGLGVAGTITTFTGNRLCGNTAVDLKLEDSGKITTANDNTGETVDPSGSFSFNNACSNPIPPPEVSKCTTLDKPGDYYLVNDLALKEPGACITINVSDVNLDLAGYTVNATGDTGIEINADNVTVSNGSVFAATGIVLRDTKNNSLDNVDITASLDGLYLDTTTTASLTNSVVHTAGGRASVYVYDDNNGFEGYGNIFQGHGFVLSNKTPSYMHTSYCEGGNDNIGGLGNLFEDGAELETHSVDGSGNPINHFGLCNDHDGNIEMDANPILDTTNLVTYDFFNKYGNEYVQDGALIKSRLPVTIDKDLSMYVEKNTPLLKALNSDSTLPAIAYNLKVSPRVGLDVREPLVINDVQGTTFANTKDTSGHIIYRDLLSGYNFGKIAATFNPASDGSTIAFTAYDNSTPGSGAEILNTLQDIEIDIEKIELPGGSSLNVLCDSQPVNVRSIATGCDKVSFTTISEIVGENVSIVSIEGLVKLQNELLEGDGLAAMQDIETSGTQSDLDNAGLKGFEQFSFTGNDVGSMAFDDSTNLLFQDHVTFDIDRMSDPVRIKMNIPAEAYGYMVDNPNFKNLPPKASVIWSTSPGAQEINATNKVVTSINGGFITSPKNQSDSSFVQDSNITFDNVQFNLGTMNTNSGTTDVIKDLGTYVAQDVPGLEAGGMAFPGDNLTIKNSLITNILDSESTVSVAAKTATENSTLYHGEYVPGVAVGNTSGNLVTAVFENNTMKNALSGFSSYNVISKVVDNDFHTKDPQYKHMRNGLIAELEHGQDYPMDQLKSDGSLEMRLNKADIQESLGAAVTAVCGKPNISFDGRNNTMAIPTAELDSHGARHTALAHDADHAICGAVIARNTATLNGGAGIVIANQGKEIDAANIVGLDPVVTAAHAINSTISMVVADNTVSPSGDVPYDSLGNPAKEVPGGGLASGLELAVADGSDLCLGSFASDVEGNGLVADGPTKVVTYDGDTATVLVDTPVNYFARNNCNNSGSMTFSGSQVLLAEYNTSDGAQYNAMNVIPSGDNFVTQSFSSHLVDNDGLNSNSAYFLKGNTLSNSGRLVNTITTDIGNSVAGSLDGIKSFAFAKDLLLSPDNSSTLLENAVFVKDNTINSIGENLLGLKTNDLGVVENSTYVTLSSNVDAAGVATTQEAVNDLTVYADAEASYDVNETADTGEETFEAMAQCSVGGNTPCDASTMFYWIDHMCYKNESTPDVALSVCGANASQAGTLNAEGTHMIASAMLLPGQYNVVAHDVANNTYSTSNVYNVPDQDNVANLKMAKDRTGKTVGLRGNKYLGSVLYVFEPVEVIWESTTAYYPFIFESDSDWTVDVCMEVPEGYVIVEPEACIQTFVSGEVKTIEFIVEEVGTINTDTELNYTLTKPNGKEIKVKSKIKNSIGKKYIQEFLAENGGNLADLGYYLDDKGRIKKIKSNNSSNN